MKTSMLPAATLLAFAMAAAPHPASAQQAPAPATTAARAPADAPPGKTEAVVEKIRTYSIAQREQAIAQAKRATDEIDARIAAFDKDTRARGAQMDAAAHKQSDAVMADLRSRRTKLEAWSTRMRQAAPPAWEEVKSGFVASYHELADAFRRARAEFDREPAPVQEKARKP